MGRRRIITHNTDLQTKSYILELRRRAQPFAFFLYDIDLHESRKIMEIRRFKNIACTVIFSMLLLLGRVLINMSDVIQLPFKVQFTIAIFFLVYGFALALWETKNDLPLFWGAEGSPFYLGVNNSSLMIAISVFFFATNLSYGLCAFGIEVALYVLISVFEWK